MVTEFVPGFQFDSRLSVQAASATRNADFTLIVKAYLERYDPPGGTQAITSGLNAGATLNQWTSGGEFHSFKMRFKRVCEEAFRDKLWLVPSADWGGEVLAGGRYWRPNVKCLLWIQLVESRVGAHLRLRCVHTPAGVGFRSFVTREVREGDLDSSALDSHANGCGVSQVEAAHELGHHLGLSHVGADEPGCNAGSELVCYCPSTWSGTDRMGGGDRTDAWHAHPWEKRIARHLRYPAPGLRWRAVLIRPAPVRTNAWAPPEIGPAPVRTNAWAPPAMRPPGT